MRVEDRKHQAYRCRDCNHYWYRQSEFGKFSIKDIIRIVFSYLRCLSYNRLNELLYCWIHQSVPKRDLIGFVEYVADQLPSLSEITKIYQPKRSGYIGLDGFWLKLKGESFVVLVAFDVQTLDIIAYHVSADEDREGWLQLINKCGSWFTQAKGFYIDGELNLVSVMKDHFSHVPIQLCVFHKEIRIGQIMPLVHLKTEEDKWLKKVFEIILYSPCEKTALRYFYKLKIAKTLDKTEKKKKVFGVLSRNFDLLMTHHDHPEMHRTNNVLEGFNGNIKQKLKVMRGIKKEKNVDRYLKLIFLDYRFRKIKNSNFKSRNNKSPLEISDCKEVPTNYHWIEKHISAR